MNKTFLCCFSLLFCSLFLWTGCAEEGCTNPIAENYNPDAAEDDFSCILPRDKFLGTYNVTENCDGDTEMYTFFITASTSDETVVEITNFHGIGAVVQGMIEGNSITITSSNTSSTIDGDGSISGNTLSLEYSVQVLDTSSPDECEVTAVKE